MVVGLIYLFTLTDQATNRCDQNRQHAVIIIKYMPSPSITFHAVSSDHTIMPWLLWVYRVIVTLYVATHNNIIYLDF
jgi:hypothetical protein